MQEATAGGIKSLSLIFIQLQSTKYKK